jgi:hypothetical protein
VKYVDGLVLLAKGETMLQDRIDKLIEIGRSYGTEMNMEKAKVMRISRQPFPVKLMIGQKQLENVESFKYLCSMLTNDGRCTVKLNPGLLWQMLRLTIRGIFLQTKWTWN